MGIKRGSTEAERCNLCSHPDDFPFATRTATYNLATEIIPAQTLTTT